MDTHYSKIQLHINYSNVYSVCWWNHSYRWWSWCAMKVCDYFWCQQDTGCVDMCSMHNKNTSACFIHVMRTSRKSCVQTINRNKSHGNSWTWAIIYTLSKFAVSHFILLLTTDMLFKNVLNKSWHKFVTVLFPPYPPEFFSLWLFTLQSNNKPWCSEWVQDHGVKRCLFINSYINICGLQYTFKHEWVSDAGSFFMNLLCINLGK